MQFLGQFPELSQAQKEALASHLTIKTVPKNTDIVTQGQYCNLCYFVLKGCLRQYIIDDGLEKTMAIYTEEQAINYYSNQKPSKPAENYLSTLEQSVLLVGNPEKDQEIYALFPQLLDITRRMLEAELGKTQEAFAQFITSSPEQRYMNLLNERPELLLRVPQHIIASYLGMTPESLSRIKKRILQKN